MVIYYDSKTGNVKRFVNKVAKLRPNWKFIKIESKMIIEEKGHLLTFTTKIGSVPETTEKFLEYTENYKNILSISSSGNMNWGVFYAIASDKINEKYDIPVCMKFELSGTQIQVEYFIDYIENFNE